MAGENEPARIDLALLDPEGTFPARLAGDRDALAGYADGLWALEAEALRERLGEIATLAHRLAGAAGTFGYHRVGDAALALEEQILDLHENAEPSRVKIPPPPTPPHKGEGNMEPQRLSSECGDVGCAGGSPLPCGLGVGVKPSQNPHTMTAGDSRPAWREPLQQAMDALARALDDGLARARR